MPTKAAIGAKIREWRDEKGMSQAQLAARTGVGERTPTRWENGESTPRPKQWQLLRELGVDLPERRPSEEQRAEAELLHLHAKEAEVAKMANELERLTERQITVEEQLARLTAEMRALSARRGELREASVGDRGGHAVPREVVEDDSGEGSKPTRGRPRRHKPGPGPV